MNPESRRLYRSSTDRVFSGLCAGLGAYSGIDPTVIRVLFALGALFFFPMPVLVYLVMMVIVPEEPAGGPTAVNTVEVIQP